jgi:hypothetical protein
VLWRQLRRFVAVNSCLRRGWDRAAFNPDDRDAHTISGSIFLGASCWACIWDFAVGSLEQEGRWRGTFGPTRRMPVLGRHRCVGGAVWVAVTTRHCAVDWNRFFRHGDGGGDQ